MAEYGEKLAMLADMQNCNVTADFTILSDERTWSVHRFVLAMHSEVLKAMFRRNFKEAREFKLDWSEYHKDVVHAVVDYLYTFNYETSNLRTPFSQTPAIHVHVAVLADRYNIRLLHQMAATKVESALEDECSPKDFADTAALAFDYEGPTETIKDVIVDMIVNDQSPGMSDELEATMLDYPELSLRVTKALRTKSLGNAVPAATTQREAQEGILDLSEHAVEEVEALVYFLYHWEYKLADDTSIFEDLCFHIDMALLADKYLVTGLVTVAKELFEFCLSDLEDDEELAELALKAYDSPDIIADMRSNIVNAVVEEKKMESKEVLQAMRTQGEFATDVALAMSKKAERSERSTRSHDGWGAWD
ncbi:unnamed protein product [Zymoseptoria tritici ST99CH_3D1]|nr:unnamed protein product [Zymoseptoria tritici ST99CH_3D1]